MQVRQLTAGDVRRLVNIARGEIDAFMALAQEASGDKEARSAEVGRAMFDMLLDRHLDTMWEWLADLAGMKVEEFDKQPASAPLEVINAVMDQDLSSFFAQARLLWARVSKDAAQKASGTK